MSERMILTKARGGRMNHTYTYSAYYTKWLLVRFGFVNERGFSLSTPEPAPNYPSIRSHKVISNCIHWSMLVASGSNSSPSKCEWRKRSDAHNLHCVTADTLPRYISVQRAWAPRTCHGTTEKTGSVCARVP